MLQGADDLSGAIRSAWIAAIATTVVVALVAYLVAGWLGAGLALGGGAVGIGNLRLAAFALDRAPMAFLGSSLPRLALITLVLAVLVLVLGPVGVWGLVGLLGTHLAQVGAVLNAAWRAARR
jgi:hypothetical protein